MSVVIKKLRKEDLNKARKFAVEGMHLHWFTSSKLELYLYSKFFLYSELSKATQALGAYMNDDLVGILLADMNDQPKVSMSFWSKIYISLASFVMNLSYKNSTDDYDETNKKMLKAYQGHPKTDGELNFFAVDPNIKGKGIGTILLNELEAREKGKHIYLFTDSGSTYQFYSHRGFKEIGRKEISFDVGGEKVPLVCMLFAKTL